MTDWGAFVGTTGVLVLLFLLLARASQSLVTGDDDIPPPADGPDPTPGDGPDPEPDDVTDAPQPAAGPLARARSFGTVELLVNVLVTHGLFAVLVAAAALYWAVPARALGVTGPVTPAVGWGCVLGLALYAGNELAAAGMAAIGLDHDETLRALLAPETPAGWVLLLGGVLPAVAVGEELVFRGVLVGAYATGLGLPEWGLAVGSSVAFALGHGAQGRGGVVVTGLLGLALAGAFVVSGSLLLVVVAHYVVNALEFAVHEGVGVEWA